jgi:hypothetical protein
VVTAAGLPGLAQAVYLASGATLNASPTLRFGIGAWCAVAAAVAAHLLYLLAPRGTADPLDDFEPNEVAGLPSTQAPEAHVQQDPSNLQPRLPDALGATTRPSPDPPLRPTVPSKPSAPAEDGDRDVGAWGADVDLVLADPLGFT